MAGRLTGQLDITPANYREAYRVAYSLFKQRMLHDLSSAGELKTAPVYHLLQPIGMVEDDIAAMLAGK
jgi:hypothetical protein